MGMDPDDHLQVQGKAITWFPVWSLVTALAFLTGLGLAIDGVSRSSATYDEVAYLRVATHWWRTGYQSEITRMGSPLLFWKLQQGPVLWFLDLLGHRNLIDDPIGNQRILVPLARLGSLWIWAVALALTAAWSRSWHGPRAMALAAWLFVLSPNLLAHGGLATMELPLAAATTAMFWSFWRFLHSKRWPWFWGASAVAGVALSCKFTAALFPPILSVVWCVARWREGETSIVRLTRHLAPAMLGFVMLMLTINFAVNGFARMPLSSASGNHPSLERWLGISAGRTVGRLYETPLPQDWVGFATQMHHQASGGASYLWGERRSRGWWYYYFVALAVKVPLSFWILVIARSALATSDARCQNENRESIRSHVDLIPLVIALFVLITAIGSSRNYGMRYLLPLAPLAIVWVSALAARRQGRWAGLAAVLGLAGFAVAIAGSHPHELTYFNILAGGSRGGRHILADSNLDWGQGLDDLARLQDEQPDFRNLTLYYFGDTDPIHYGVAGRSYVINAVDDQSRLAHLDRVQTPYVAVSASLQWGPWGPPDFFRDLDRLTPVRLTDDTTIAIYRTADLRANMTAHQ
jgi:hypothetical protein